MTDQRRPPTAKPASASRQEREAAALRANLARRKAQSRGRTAVEGEASAQDQESGRDDEARG
ncbi:hypothetical protein [Inquilinus sp. Marseille-Q2685]|uniref:hypothetical protein n=1 Tax=Inquilinus sp. Marseille-Q2685 TaxID=2866581 RepID=UPI001CE3F2FA|nr:hypothetical protein [Inquilinus sp. Marseille-Q2685]